MGRGTGRQRVVSACRCCGYAWTGVAVQTSFATGAAAAEYSVGADSFVHPVRLLLQYRGICCTRSNAHIRIHDHGYHAGAVGAVTVWRVVVLGAVPAVAICSVCCI